MTSPTPMLATATASIPDAVALPAREAAAPATRAGLNRRAPGTSPVASGARTHTAQLLETLADLYTQGKAGEQFAVVCLRWLSPHGSDDDRWARFEDLVEALRLREGVATGVLHWSEVDGELTCPNPSEAAHDIACGRVDDAVNALLGGVR